MVNSKTSLRKFVCRHHDLSNRSVLSSFMIYHRVCNKCNLTGAHVEHELLTLPKYLSSLPFFSGVRVARSLVFCIVYCRRLFVIFLLSIVLSVLRLTPSNFHFSLLVFLSSFRFIFF